MSTQTTPNNNARLSAGGMVTQTLAMLHDAYRELNSKKLFWITMILSGIVVLAFGAVGFDERGFSVFGKQFQHGFLNTTVIPKAELYKNLFLALGVNTWLGYFALILALVSTAPMFPDFLSGGAIDLYLARPLGRTRLFLTKYVVGLLFVAVQVAVFCVASFLVIGIRGGVWVPGVFLAVPIVVLMFSYLWSICAFVGTVTRSTIASLLLTLLAWFAVFGVHAAESALLTFSIGSRIEAQELDADIKRYEGEIATINARTAATGASTQPSNRVRMLTASLEIARKQRAEADDPFKVWHAVAYAVKWPLPKTTETTDLLARSLDRQFREPGDVGEPSELNADAESSRNFFHNPRTQRLTEIEVENVMRSRSATWVIGTSLLFEAAMLGLATWVFSRRDY